MMAGRAEHAKPLPFHTHMPAAEADTVSKRFGTFEALRGISLSIEPGTTFALLGPNGSGKTTLIRLLAGLLRPTSGEVRVLGEQPEGDALAQVGYMPQGVGLYAYLSVWENIRAFGGVQGVHDRRRLEETLDLVDILDVKHKVVEKLSGGYARRLSLACAIVHRPRLLLLDEPTVGVDPYLRRVFWQLFDQFTAEGSSVVLTTHVMDEAERCDRIGVLRAGRLLAQGSAAQIRAHFGAATLEDVFVQLAEARE